MSVLSIEDKSCIFQYENVKQEDLLNKLIEWAGSGKSDVYAMFTNEVVLGICRDGELLLGHVEIDKWNDTLVEKSFNDVQDLREIRIFNTQQEVKAVRLGNEFKIRVLQDSDIPALTETVAGKKELVCLQETHKIWGAFKDTASTREDWSLLTSERGSRLYFPAKLVSGAEKGVVVRNYIEFEDHLSSPEEDWKPKSGYRFVDERMVEFVDWKPEGGRKNE